MGISFLCRKLLWGHVTWHPDTREQQAWTLGDEGEETGQGGIPPTPMPLAAAPDP